MINKQDIVLLMTGSVRPANMPNTVLVNSNRRLNQYVSAIQFYIKETPYRIVFVENTNTDLSHFFDEDRDRCEFITFNGNNFDVKLGKGYGEGLIIKEAFQNSIFFNERSYVIKISGRYILSNFNEMADKSFRKKSFNSNYILCNINPYSRGGHKYASSVMFGANVNFYKKYFLSSLKRIDESNGVWFEHVLYESIHDAIQQHYKLWNFPIPIIKEVESGSTGQNFKHPSLLIKFAYWVKYIMYKFRLFRI